MTAQRTPGLRAPAQDVRVLAFYRLPNPPSATSGAELPEWRDVRVARPAFAAHEQPRVPSELGYCDVRSASVREAQAALAAAHAVSGFCYVFQMTEGAATPDSILADIVASRRPDFPFCVCWETTRPNAEAGFGAEDVARQRRYSREECAGLVRALLPALRDARYIRVSERPLLLVSSPDSIPEVRAVAALWRDECIRAGVGDPCLARFGGGLDVDPAIVGFDAIVERPPLGHFPRSRRDEFVPPEAELAADVRSYRSYVVHMLAVQRTDHTVFRTVMPGWDESARSPAAPTIFVDGNPETFGYWTERALDQARRRLAFDQRLLFVRSWNEWDAACYLEPDARHGRRYLEALRAAVQRPPVEPPARPSWPDMKQWRADGGLPAVRVLRSRPDSAPAKPGPLVSVVMPAYNHERYVVEALDSVLSQSHVNIEIIAVDDGSRDATAERLDDYASRCRSHALTIVHQPNAGAHEAINHGLALARGEVVAILNSDDRFVPLRLERLLAEMERRRAALAFSRVRYIDGDGLAVAATNPLVAHTQRAVAEALSAPDPVFTLVHSNIAVSTGNLVFRRELLERTGGFCAMRVAHDWDFLLAASFETPLAFVDEPLYEYRLHGDNTVTLMRLENLVEVEHLQARFFDRLADHPVARDRAVLEQFLAQVRRLGLGSYLSKGFPVK
jgi:glycosyltransferase involved in cell wall biosynthesis